MNRLRSWLRLPWLTSFAALIVIALVIRPVFWRALIHVGSPAQEVSEQLRIHPGKAVMDELSAQNLQDIPLPQGEVAVRMADRYMSGQDILEYSSGTPHIMAFVNKDRETLDFLRRIGDRNDFQTAPYSVPFSKQDLLRDDGIGALPYSSLYIPAVLIQAFNATGRDKYLSSARDGIVAFSRYERSAWVQRAFLWNDHAVAARVGVLIRFWHLYRGSPLYQKDDANLILTHVERCAAIIASNYDYAAATNHGVMSNLALLQLAAAFPELLDWKPYISLAMDRLANQLDFYVDDEGFVLEHSAHYHEMGVDLISMAIKLAEMNHLAVPATWRGKYESAKKVLVHLKRPDGTLAVFGDTELEVNALKSGGAARVRAANDFSLFPVSGYAIWSFDDSAGADSHSVAAWSYFPGHGHKLADEMSLVVWGKGRGWITNTGYWDYGAWGRGQASGWQGGNAPHWKNESAGSSRHTELTGFASSQWSVALEMHRVNASGARLGRQIVSLSRGVWLVVDTVPEAGKDGSETIWTFYPDLSLEQVADDNYRVGSADGQNLSVSVRHGAGSGVSMHKGDRSPFAGWVALGRKGVPAPALVIDGAPGAWTATLFSLGNEAPQTLRFELRNEHEWEASGSGWTVRRQGANLNLGSGDRTEALTLAPPPNTDKQHLALEKSFAVALDQHPRYPDLDSYRLRLALMLSLILFAQEGALAIYSRRGAGGRHVLPARVCLLLGWGMGALWLQFRYFAT